MQLLSMLSGYQGGVNLVVFFTKTTMSGKKGIIWLSQSSLTQHHKMVVLIRCRFICTLVRLSTFHTTAVVEKCGFRDYIFYSNRSLNFISLRGLDKYGS